MQTQKRQALVIGNSRYLDVRQLNAPQHDARRIAEHLLELKFEVELILDASLEDFVGALARFTHRVESTRGLPCVFYFSGHGVQIGGKNFLVPIDFSLSIEDAPKLIDLKRVLDATAKSQQRILILDACRAAEEVVDAFNGDVRVPEAKYDAIPRQRARMGLTEIDLSQDTFIAFAAGPGALAFDDERDLSYFTKALDRNIRSVDLPITNLAARVRRDVLRDTDGKQQTWDQSSLTTPFYFNAGNIYMFLGNIMTLTSLLLSLVPYSLILLESSLYKMGFFWIFFSTVFPIISLIIFIYGIKRVFDRLRGIQYADHSYSKRMRFVVSLESGGIGGYIAALYISVPFTVLYYSEAFKNYAESPLTIDRPPSLGQMMVRIALATCLFAVLFGFLTQFISNKRSANQVYSGKRALHQILIGSIMASLISCASMGPLLMATFGSMALPEVRPNILLPGLITGVPVIVFFISIFDFERISNRRIMSGALASICCVGLGLLFVAIIFGPLYSLNVVQLVIKWLEANSGSVFKLLVGGLIYGIPVGLVLGIVTGFALVLTERWSAR